MLLSSVTKDYIDIFSANKIEITVNTNKGIQNGYPYFFVSIFDKEKVIWLKKTKKIMGKA